MKNEFRWTLVQHSGFGYNGDSTFERGLEVRQIRNPVDIKLVENSGGVLFESYSEADSVAEDWMYPDDGNSSLVPAAMGEFSDQKIDGLRIYIPVRMIVG